MRKKMHINKITTKIKANNQDLVQTSLLGLVMVTHLYAEP